MSATAHLVAMPAADRTTDDTDRPPEPSHTDGALALQITRSEPDQDLASERTMTRQPPLRLVRRSDDNGDDEDLPDVQVWAVRLVQAVAEVVAGDRPIGQLVRWTDGTVYAELNRRVRLLGLTTTASARTTSERAAIRSIHVTTPAPRTAEVAAHIHHNNRSRALALRLEIHRNRWICTALTLG